MARNTKRGRSSPGKGIDLDSALDTSGTFGVTSKEEARQRSSKADVQEVGPLMVPTKPGQFSLSDIPSWVKTAASASFVIVGLVVSAAWYLSKLDSNVETLKTDVHEVKIRTDDLFRTSVQHGEKMETLKKSIDGLNEKTGDTPKKP